MKARTSEAKGKMGKGSKRRPPVVPEPVLKQNWDVTFAPIAVPAALADWAFEYKLGYQSEKGTPCPIKPWHSYAQARAGAWKAGQRAGRKARSE